MVTVTDISRSTRIEEIVDISALLSQDSVIDVEIPMRGLLVRESIVVSHCSRNHLEAQTSNISHFCTGTYNYPLFIKVRGTNKIVVGRLADLLVYTGKLCLSDFKVLNQVWIDRQTERVQPKQPTFVTFVNGKNQSRANLFDLSKCGMGILVDRSIDATREELINADVLVLLKIPPKNTLCRVPAKVTQVHAISGELTRIGLKTSPSSADEKIFDRYLSERKREILDEVFTNFKEMLNFRETKDMYF